MKKNQYSFTLFEIEQLDEELNGKKDEVGQISEPGLLDSVINLKLKFLLSQINSSVALYRQKIMEFRNKLIYKMGKKNDQGIPEIPVYMFEMQGDVQVQVPHPTFQKFDNELTKYKNKSVQIESYPIELDLLATVARKERYPMLMKYLEQQFVLEEVVK